MMIWIGVTSLQTQRVFLSGTVGSGFTLVSPDGLPGEKYFAVAVAVVAVPVYAAVVLVHDYLVVGHAAALPRATTSPSPAELEDGLRLALADPGLRLMFHVPDGDRVIDTAARQVQLSGVAVSYLQELTVSGTALGLFVWSGDRRPDPRRLAVLAAVLVVPLARAQMQLAVLSRIIDLTDSRRRLLEAEATARRRIERDLHDGAQQRLTATLILLSNAATSPNPRDLARSASDQVQEALREIQALARGLYSPTLTSSGLAAAVGELAERMPIPVEVRVSETRLAELVEVTSYLVVKECLANIIKYASATEAAVRAEVADGALRLVVEDDGCGGVDPTAGTGLLGLADRAEALGGTLDVYSPTGGGTCVTLILPDASL